MKAFWRRLKVVPFEALIALFAAYSGAVSLLGIGPTATALTLQLPPWLVNVLNIVFLLAGLAMVFGIGVPRRSLEAFGLVLVLMSVVVRTLALQWLVGATADTLNGLVLNSLTVIFLWVRLSAVIRGSRLLQIEDGDRGLP